MEKDKSTPKIYEGKLSASGIKFGIVISRFNEFITSKLLDGALDCLRRHGADDSNIDIIWVPGSFEIPVTVKKLTESKRYNSIIALGAIIRGDTPHFDYLCAEVYKGIAHISLETGIPIPSGIITADTIEQAIERAGTKAGNKGWDSALSAIEMVNLFSELGK